MPIGNLRDAKDIPVLSDALFHHADIILSGDKDFIEADIERPLVFSPSMLYDYLISQQGL
jgi:predicted nucleic acid-binding protein